MKIIIVSCLFAVIGLWQIQTVNSRPAAKEVDVEKELSQLIGLLEQRGEEKKSPELDKKHRHNGSGGNWGWNGWFGQYYATTPSPLQKYKKHRHNGSGGNYGWNGWLGQYYATTPYPYQKSIDKNLENEHKIVNEMRGLLDNLNENINTDKKEENQLMEQTNKRRQISPLKEEIKDVITKLEKLETGI